MLNETNGKPAGVAFRSSFQPTIEYRQQGRAIVRTAKQADQVVHMDSFGLPAGTELSWTLENGSPSAAAVQISGWARRGGKLNATPPQRIETRAVPFADHPLVIIASPNVFHREHAVAALQAGKDVIIEKPFACTNREAWDIVEAAKKSNRRVMVGCNYRFWEQHLIAKDLLTRGVIGELKQGTSKSHEAWSLYHEMISFTRFRADAELAGAGALFDLGSHMTDLLIWLMGSKPKRVCGTAKNLTRPSSYTTLDDCVFIQIEFENGSYGVVDLNRFSPAVTVKVLVWPAAKSAWKINRSGV